MATLTVTTITKNSITLTLTGVNQNTSGQRACSWKIRRHDATYGDPTWTYLAAGETQTSKKYTGLYAGTSYDVQAAYQEVSGGSYTTIAKTAIITTSPSGTLTISNITETSATVSISSFNPYDSGETKETCYAYLWFGTGSTATARESGASGVTIASSNIPYSGGSYNKTNLSSGTTYTFEYRIQPSSDTTVTWKISESFTTDTPATGTGDIIICGMTTSSITFKIINATAGYWYWRKKDSNSSSWPSNASGNTQVTTSGGSSGTITFSGLSFGNFYDFKASYQTNYGEVSVSKLNCAPSSGSRVSYFSYQTWNQLVESVNKALVFNEYTWTTNNGEFLTKTNTLISSSNKTLTAGKFNSLWYNLWLHLPNGSILDTTATNHYSITGNDRGRPASNTRFVYADLFSAIASGINSLF